MPRPEALSSGPHTQVVPSPVLKPGPGWLFLLFSTVFDAGLGADYLVPHFEQMEGREEGTGGSGVQGGSLRLCPRGDYGGGRSGFMSGGDRRRGGCGCGGNTGKCGAVWADSSPTAAIQQRGARVGGKTGFGGGAEPWALKAG